MRPVWGGGPVPRRVATLIAPPPLLLAAVAAIVLVSGLAALDAARNLHAIFKLAQCGQIPWPGWVFGRGDRVRR